MKRFLSLLMLSCAIGCGGGKPDSPGSAEKSQPGQSAPLAMPTGKPSAEEAVSTIRQFFSQPGVGFSNVQIEKISEAVEAPPEAGLGWGEVWVYAVTMHCEFLGDRQLNKDWLVLMNRENGRATVKDYYHNLERVQFSPLGKDWFVSKGFADPDVVHDD
jgi:hypothetical protein